MKKALLSGAFIAVFSVYTFHQSLENGAAITYSADTGVVPNTPAASLSAPAPIAIQPTQTPPSPAPAPAPAPAPTPAPAPQGQYKDGVYTGSVADAYYGYIQVQASVSGGTLANVVFLQHPSDRSTSRMINNAAMPMLKQEALAAQSANVNIVSGATDSSYAFIQSLGSALAQAKN